MGQALYRKYRSKAFGEVVGQEHITTALENALKTGTISHAYLFTGPRGVGKTSVARILAHAANDLPYTDESTHLDIIEIDAASHRRIDEIRELRERVHIAPTSAKYKVYIIDEVHMLTREAFNALLKTLEEPPAHVIFILATTEAHKLPETIISRTQRFNFRPIDQTAAVKHLRNLAKTEKIDIDDEALRAIARHGNGSLRDSISLLDQLRTGSTRVIASDVLAMLGQVPDELIGTVLEALAAQNSLAVITALKTLRDQGYEAPQVAKQLGERLRASLTDNTLYLDRRQTLALLGKLIEVPASYDPTIALELAMLESITDKLPVQPVVTLTAQAKESQSAEVPKTKAQPKPVSKPEPAPPTAKTAPKPAKATALGDDIWPKVLDTLKQQHNTLYGIARMASPSVEPGTLTLACHFAFHQKRLNDTRNRAIITDIIKDLTGQDVAVTCVLDASLPRPESNSEDEPTPPEANQETLQSISNIFGGAELLQSE